jgi:hypothetical protein
MTADLNRLVPGAIAAALIPAAVSGCLSIAVGVNGAFPPSRMTALYPLPWV